MAHKRFTDKDIWKLEWFRRLSPTEKCAWNYLKDNCDNVGVIKLDRDLADFVIGEKVDWDSFIKKTNNNIEILENGKWWIIDFVDFQYGNLRGTIKDKARMSYITLLEKHDLLKKYKGLSRGFEAHKEKEKDKDKEKEKEEEVEKIYSLYPGRCPTRNQSNGKSHKNKDKIKALLDDGYTVESLTKLINAYVDDCKKSKSWMKNFSTFLNNLPDYEGMKPIDNMSRKEKKQLEKWNKEEAENILKGVGIHVDK